MDSNEKQCEQAQQSSPEQVEATTLSQIFYNDGINGLLAYFRRRIDEATKPLHERIERLVREGYQLRKEISEWREVARKTYSRAVMAEVALSTKSLNIYVDEACEPSTVYGIKSAAIEARAADWGCFTIKNIEPPKALTCQTLLDAQKQLFDSEQKQVFYMGGHRSGATDSTISRIIRIAKETINKEQEAHAATMCKLESSRKTIAQALETAETLSRELSEARSQVSGRDAILHTRKLQIGALRKVVDNFAGPGVSSLCLDRPEVVLDQTNKTEVTK